MTRAKTATKASSRRATGASRTDKKNSSRTGTARGHVVVAKPPTGDQKEHPKDGGVPWMYADSELAGRREAAV